MNIPFKPESPNFRQRQLFPTNIFDLLPSNHDCFLFYDLFQQLDTSEVEAQYSPIGQHAYHPRQLFSILIYGYTHGVFSSRQLEKRCRQDLSFMYIAGQNCPNFRVLSDFRKDNADFFRSCFKQTVQLALEMKLVTLGHVSLDGSKFKANSSKHKAMSYEHLKEKEVVLMQEIDALIAQANASDAIDDAIHLDKQGDEIPKELQFKQQRLKTVKAAKEALEARELANNPGQTVNDIEDKAQISFADKEARIMGKNGQFDYSYNGQISVDSKHQIIVGQHVSQCANDTQEVEPALRAIKASTNKVPDKMSLDNGYASGDNFNTLEKAGIDAYLAIDRDEKTHTQDINDSERKLVKADFIYDKENDQFTCPHGQILPFKKLQSDNRRIYQGAAETCANCPYHKRCCQSKKGEARTVSTDSYEPLRQQMRERMSQDESKAIYKQRKTIVEPVFGQLKNSGFRSFSLRGLTKVQGEFALLCTGHNLKKIVKTIMTGEMCLKFGKMAINRT